MWGELAGRERLFSPPSQFSRLGIHVSLRAIFPNLLPCVCYGFGWDYLSFFPLHILLLKSICIHLSPGSSCGLVAYTCAMVFFMGHTAIFLLVGIQA